jgi:hypothetical protein
MQRILASLHVSSWSLPMRKALSSAKGRPLSVVKMLVCAGKNAVQFGDSVISAVRHNSHAQIVHVKADGNVRMAVLHGMYGRSQEAPEFESCESAAGGNAPCWPYGIRYKPVVVDASFPLVGQQASDELGHGVVCELCRSNELITQHMFESFLDIKQHLQHGAALLLQGGLNLVSPSGVTHPSSLSVVELISLLAHGPLFDIKHPDLGVDPKHSSEQGDRPQTTVGLWYEGSDDTFLLFGPSGCGFKKPKETR